MREEWLFHKYIKETKDRRGLDGHKGLGGRSPWQVVVVRADWLITAAPAPMWPMTEIASDLRSHHYKY